MRSVLRWLFVTALVVAGAWICAIVGSSANLLTLFDGFDDAIAEARVVVDQTSLEPDAEEEVSARGADSRPLAAAESDGGLSLQQISSDELSATQIMGLLEDEIAADTDPAAADELLRAFGESLDTQE